MHEQQSQQWEKNVTTQVHLFGLTNKAMWPKSLMSGAKINCHVCLWICSLPVSAVTARIRCWWLCIIFTLLDDPFHLPNRPIHILFQVLIRISLQNLLIQLERAPYLPSLKVIPCGMKIFSSFAIFPATEVGPGGGLRGLWEVFKLVSLPVSIPFSYQK